MGVLNAVQPFFEWVSQFFSHLPSPINDSLFLIFGVMILIGTMKLIFHVVNR